MNLSRKDEVMTLIDEDGNEYPTIYLARKTGLSGGWKGFAVAHELVDGDALIFQLIRPSAFKVIEKFKKPNSISYTTMVSHKERELLGKKKN